MRKVFPVVLGVSVLALVLTGCGNMKRQRYARSESAVPALPQGTSAQASPAHVVPRHAGIMPRGFERGNDPSGALATKLPVPLTRALLERGAERFRIYCAVCHGEDGYGRGIVVRRGFPAPPSLHDERLRNVPAGYFVQVITDGHGLMFSYADRVAADDRWAIAAYIRTLQLSQRIPVNRLSAADRSHLGLP